jgi:hypothetical protein
MFDANRSADDQPMNTFIDSPYTHNNSFDGHWLVAQRNAGRTPAEITNQLVDAGWDADQAARWSLRSLRSSDHHHLTYAAVTWMTGLAALSGATSLHLLLDKNPEPVALAIALTLFFATAPLAVWSHIAMRRAEEESPYAIWSPDRRLWFATLATCSGIVGLIRLLGFLYLVSASLTGAIDKPLDAAAVVQVLVSVGVSVPLFVWSLREWRRSALLVSGLADAHRDTENTGIAR